MFSKNLTITAIASAILLVGCGGGGSSSSNDSAKAYYYDSAVAGVEYRCGYAKGNTDKDGSFEFEAGKDCDFFLGDVKIKVVKSKELFPGKIIVEDNETVAALLQTLDYDGNASNGIEIRKDAIKAINKHLKDVNKNHIMPIAPTFIDEVANELSQNVAGYNGHKVDVYEAHEHLHKTHQDVIKKFIANKSFYAVAKSEYHDAYMAKVKIDADVKHANFENKESLNIEIKGPKIFIEGNYYDFKQYRDYYYLYCKDNKEEIRLYKKEQLAKKYYNSIK